MNLAQTLEVFATLNGPADAFEVVRGRSGTWFDPDLVRAVGCLEEDYTQRILEKIQGFQHLAFIASTHHENWTAPDTTETCAARSCRRSHAS